MSIFYKFSCFAFKYYVKLMGKYVQYQFLYPRKNNSVLRFCFSGNSITPTVHRKINSFSGGNNPLFADTKWQNSVKILGDLSTMLLPEGFLKNILRNPDSAGSHGFFKESKKVLWCKQTILRW